MGTLLRWKTASGFCSLLNSVATSITHLAVAAAAALCIAATAQASPRFTVENTSDDTIDVHIYSGGDTLCTHEEKTKKVSPGETKTIGCNGNGKGKCKVQFYFDIDQICKSARNTCDGKAIKLEGGATTKISWDGNKFRCAID